MVHVVNSLLAKHVIDDADLAELFPEQTSSAPVQQPNFSTFSVHNASPDNDDKSIADNGDGSGSEMELTPQLVTAAIQRATAESSGSDNDCSNSDTINQNPSHYASSLLQQFVAQTQLLSSSASITSINNATALAPLSGSQIENVASISDCVLGQINSLPDITTTFLSSNQHLSPQQSEELRQINKDLEEISSVAESVDISLHNPPSLEDDIMSMEITAGGSELVNPNDLLKHSPLNDVSSDSNALNQVDPNKLDAISMNSVESQDDAGNSVVESRRKRGRPRKVRKLVEYANQGCESRMQDKSAVNVINEFNSNDPPNVSPDSGILSNHNSPTHSPLRRHDIDDVNSKHGRKSILKENNTKTRKNARSKSMTRSRTHNKSDSSDCDFRKKKIENEIKQIKTEAPSPVPLKQEQNKFEKTKRNDHKLDIAALDRMLYATDRVLYPPRKKVGRKPQSKPKTTKPTAKALKDKNQYNSPDSDNDSISPNRSVLSGVYAKRKELNSKLANLPRKNNKVINNSWRDNQSENEAADDLIDPTWKQIDLHPRFKDILSGYKSDYEFKPYKSCSKVIESGYRSDYGCRSGYKSDHYRSGYKTDFKSGYKTDKSGYKTDYSVRSSRRPMKKLKKSRSVRNRSYYKNQKHFVSDQDIILLTNKTFSSLTLGHSSSDSEREPFLRKPSASPKYVSVCTKYPMPSKYDYSYKKMSRKSILRPNSTDPFAPGPVFSGLQRPITTYNIFKVSHNNNNSLLKSPSKVNYTNGRLPSLKPTFTQKFGVSPITSVKLSKKDPDSKHPSRNLSPKNRKLLKSSTTAQRSKKESPKQLPSIFEKAKNSYIPNKELSRNVFLNFKKSFIKPTYHIKKHRPVVLAPPKINLKPIERPSRITIKTENKHHKHRSRRRHRSRSVSRCRDSYNNRSMAETLDQKFNNDMDNLITSFIKLCQIAPKFISSVSSSPRSTEKEKILPETVATAKVVKRASKKRKTSDNPEIATPTSKRRHKKQLMESHNKGGKETNEHKLPLKKRHYHINSSTTYSLSLSLVTTEFEEHSKSGTSPEKFLCTETDCLVDITDSQESSESKNINEKIKKIHEISKNVLSPNDSDSKSSTSFIKEVNESLENSPKKEDDNYHSSTTDGSPSILDVADVEMLIQKPSSDQSEFSKKIYETSEKLKAVHKMVHELEKSLPKSKEDETNNTKLEAHRVSSPRSENKPFPVRNTIVTPKKRHRLEAEKVLPNSNLDQVAQSLSKKILDEKGSQANSINDKNLDSLSLDKKEVDKTNIPAPNTSESGASVDPLKSMSARSLYKSAILPQQKSEIMTRKKNRLEGLTSNLVSKISPSAATKVLDTLLNNNIRKSIESRILEKEKTNISESTVKSIDDKGKGKDSCPINTRASVIKSPVSKCKLLETKKAKTPDRAVPTIIVNEDKPTGIFEPSVDLEDQIPKSSISVSNILVDAQRTKNKLKTSDKNANSLLVHIDTESEIPLALISETPDPIIRPKRGESIAAVISDKIQETNTGHNLRQPKRNLTSDSDDTNDKKKKKTSNSIIRESKLVLPQKILMPKVQAERLHITEVEKKSNSQATNVVESVSNDAKSMDSLKKKTRRRKAFNRTGFPSVKKKKKKIEPVAICGNVHVASEETDSSAFDRVPKSGEAMSTFLERTGNKQPELKVVLSKDDCPKQGRLTVVAIEKLQGKVTNENKKQEEKGSQNKKTNTSILRAPSLQLKQSKADKDIKSHINKWEVLSETDSIPSLASSSGNDPEDSIPLSLLNAKQKDPGTNKRKSRALSPSNEIEEIMSKRKIIENNTKVCLRPKSSLAVLYPRERRQTRSFDTIEDSKIKTRKSENKKNVEGAIEKVLSPMSIMTRRKSRCQLGNKTTNDIHSSSRESSLDTIVSRKVVSKSRETSVDTLQDQDENEPLPLNEKEIDFEKSIDVISKNVICKKRAVASRDDSPSNSIDREKAVSKKNPRLRKKFLVAGLFSDYYKEDPKPEGKGKNIVTQTEFPPGLLTPPPYCERWVRKRLIHFTLPYDIWWEQHYNQPVPSWNYKKIKTNVYYDVKPSADECESVACNCAAPTGCNEDCINRLRIQRHEWASALEKFMTENKGWGVRTKHKITSGDFILEYVGEVVSDKEFKERMATRYARDTHHYCLHLDGGLVIDGHRMGGDGRFVNHSCRPNCEMQKWTANGTFRMALFALRDIEPGEELTYDYNFSLFNPAVGQPCKCDSEDCRGVIGGKSQRITRMPQKTQSRTPSNASNQSSSSAGQQPRVGRPRKAVKCNKKTENLNEEREVKNMTILKYQQHLNKLWQDPSLQEPQFKPLTVKERALVKERHCFLFRNLENVRRIRERITLAIPPSPSEEPAVPSPQTPESVTVDPLALPDTMNPQVFLDKLQTLRASKEEVMKLSTFEDDPSLETKARMSRVFKALYLIVTSFKGEEDKPLCTPILKLKNHKSDSGTADLSKIQQKIDAGEYESVAQFDSDMSGLLSALIREHTKMTAVGMAATQLKKVYNTAKLEFADHLTKILGSQESLPSSFIQKSKPEEIILCICGLHVEEGLMVQCGNPKCGVWQHARCMRLADTNSTHYCHLCSTEPVDREIPLDEYTEEGHQFYLSLMRGGLQVRQGDTVYVLRDIPIDPRRPDGRPVGASEAHVYICELRVDRTAHLFTKISRPKYPICCKPYAFQHFPQRLKPHEVSPEYLKGRAGKNFLAPPEKPKTPQESKKKIAATNVAVTINNTKHR
ncbi:unnamed protein product [Leptidea sinapis]|uniref:Histone-lysine N-methyltransferase ash1 n=1 Tax=Leptidea sinapis TaxID=189913 RepID=A0A5E4PR13_9NEOP|nr:unnamed protein product [Leptidea sinapis]